MTEDDDQTPAELYMTAYDHEYQRTFEDIDGHRDSWAKTVSDRFLAWVPAPYNEDRDRVRYMAISVYAAMLIGPNSDDVAMSALRRFQIVSWRQLDEYEQTDTRAGLVAALKHAGWYEDENVGDALMRPEVER
jgi:hypothetical protein